jgi:hypothetical protein
MTWHPSGPVGHPIRPCWAPRLAPSGTPSGSHWAPRLAPSSTPSGPVGHSVWPPSGTPSGPIGHPVRPPRRAPVWPPSGTPSGRRQVEKIKIKIIYLFLVVVAGWKRGQKKFQFSVFNPQDPRVPRAPRASRAKPREEEGFFGLVPLVTHPSSIPLLGGLTPKFLSLSFHSL